MPYASPGVVPAGGGTDAVAPLGTVLNGRYRIARVLGAGAFGRVYLAEDLQDPGRPSVAVKELLDRQFSSPDDKREAISWFKREVSALLTLEHAGIPVIYGYWTAHTTAGPFYLAMEYISGTTLDQALQDAGGHVPWPRVVAWGLALCGVLGYLHSRTPPVVCCDLKLLNVMLDSRMTAPVLIDLGLARQLAPAGGTAIGIWGYVPYEQILGQATRHQRNLTACGPATTIGSTTRSSSHSRRADPDAPNGHGYQAVSLLEASYERTVHPADPGSPRRRIPAHGSPRRDDRE